VAGRGPAPKRQRNRTATPERGEWKPTPGIGWQYGAIPKPPDGLLAASRTAWATWLKAWFASHWTPDDLPGLRQLVRLYDQVERGEFQRAAELRLLMDTYGVTPKGAQDRRWVKPPAPVHDSERPETSSAPYSHLRVVGK
jgi:hypothetical protein